MKRLNKKGFTLIELLAVIVVLAVIMVIATQQVNAAIKKARRDSFISSYKILLKDIKFRIAQEQLGESTSIECASISTCANTYDVSEKDYTMAVSKVTSGYSFELAAKAGGKLANIDIKDVCPVAEACLDATRIKVCIDSEGKVKKCS